MFSRLHGLAALGLLALATSAAQAQPLFLQPANFGMLTQGDPYDSLRPNSHHKVYAGYLMAGKTYVFDLKSTQFDPILRVETMGGQQVALDDDSGKGLNARIKFTPKVSNNYRIIVTSFKAEVTGSFVLTYHSWGELAPLWLQPGPNFDALTHADPFDNLRPKSHQKVFLLSVTAGDTYVLDMVSKQFDTFLRIETPFGKVVATDDDSGKGLNSRIVFQPKTSGVYRVIATSFAPEKTGKFDLKLHVLPGATTAQIFHGALTFADPKDLAGRRFDVHPVFLTAGKTYTIKMNSPTFDTMLKVKNGAGKVVAANDDFAGSLNAQVTFTPLQSGMFQIIATSYAPGATGHYSLVVISQ